MCVVMSQVVPALWRHYSMRCFQTIVCFTEENGKPIKGQVFLKLLYHFKQNCILMVVTTEAIILINLATKARFISFRIPSHFRMQNSVSQSGKCCPHTISTRVSGRFPELESRQTMKWHEKCHPNVWNPSNLCKHLQVYYSRVWSSRYLTPKSSDITQINHDRRQVLWHCELLRK